MHLSPKPEIHCWVYESKDSSEKERLPHKVGQP